MPVDLKSITPDTSLPQTGFLFGADSQSAVSPSVYPVANVKDALNSGIGMLASEPAITWDTAANPTATVTLTTNATLYASNFKAGGTYKLIVFQDATGGCTLAYDPNFKWPNDTIPTVSAGANAMTVFEFVSNGTYLYGTVSQAYDGSPAPTVSGLFARPANDYSTLSTLSSMPAGGSVSRSGNAMQYDSTGRLTWAPNNLLLNSETLSTQTVTVTVGATNILSFYGTGSVAISGGYTGTLSGTGASNRVSLVFSPTTTSVTLTVTGSVTQAQFERVTWQTSPRDYLVTTSAARYEPRFDVDPVTLQSKGLLVEGARTNLLTYSDQFNNADWSPGTYYASVSANSVASPDGTTTADKIVADTSANAHLLRRYNLPSFATSTTYTLSVYAKTAGYSLRLQLYDGVAIAITDFDLSAGTKTTTSGSATITPVGNGWYRCSVTATTNSSVSVSLADVGIYKVGTGNTFAGDGTSGIYVWGAQLEAATFPSSYIPTQASSVARAAETFTLTGYANRLIEAYWIEQETGVASSIPETVVSSGAVTINPPAFGWVTSLRAYQNAYAGDIATPSWIDNSGTNGNRMVTDSTGTLTWAPHNLLLNSATLSTQTVTVTSGATNILSFTGTGSITYSGAASGTLSGTGASNRVSVVLTITTASLTLTVSGSVTQAQLERVTYQTQPRAYIPTTSAAVFMPRYDFDGSTSPASPRGMLIEEARTNLLTYSQDFADASWSKQSVSVTPNSTVAPDGTTTADLVIPSTTPSTQSIFKTGLASGVYTASVYAKAGGVSTFVLLLNTASNGATFNLSAGTSTVTGTATATITPVGNGWYRCTVYSATAGTDYRIYLPSSSSTASGDGVSGVYFWGAQLELGAFSTSLIPTTTGSVQRVSDQPIINATAFAASFSSIRGTYISQFRTIWTGNAVSSAIIVEFDNANNRVLSILSGTQLQFSNVNGANDLSPTGSIVGVTARAALGYDANGRSTVVNGGTVATSSVAFPTNLTLNRIGQNSGGVSLNGYIQSLAYYNSRLPDATLQKKSAVGAAY